MGITGGVTSGRGGAPVDCGGTISLLFKDLTFNFTFFVHSVHGMLNVMPWSGTLSLWMNRLPQAWHLI